MGNGYIKYTITCRPNKQSLLDRVLKKTIDFQIWAPKNIDDIKKLVDTRVYQIISSKKSEEKISSIHEDEIYSTF